ncbi:MAG: hypothetical protein V1787_02485 [Candidatus Micrarchaeota archaeon]
METVSARNLRKDLKEIKEELACIKAVLVEEMTSEDKRDLKHALREYRQGKTASIEDI